MIHEGKSAYNARLENHSVLHDFSPKDFGLASRLPLKRSIRINCCLLKLSAAFF